MFLGLEALLVHFTVMYILAIVTFRKTPYRKRHLRGEKCPVFPYFWKSMSSLRKTVFESNCSISGRQYDSPDVRASCSLDCISGHVVNASVA